MTDPSHQSAEVMAEYIDLARLKGHCLIANDHTKFLDNALRINGATIARWNRRSGANVQALPVPPEGPYDNIFLRITPSREELEMNLHLAHALLGKDGSLFLFGSNNEGIKSAHKRMDALYNQISPVMTKRHCRVLSARKANDENSKPQFDDWKELNHIETPQGPLTLATWPGLFAKGRLDRGTEFLLKNLPPLSAGMTVLDYGCGPGTISLALSAIQTDLEISLLDADSVALVAAKENLPDGKSFFCGSSLEAVGKETYDLIISNPPIHTGKEQTFDIFRSLCATAPDHMNNGGRLLCVVQRTVPAARILSETTLKQPEILAEDRSYRIWLAHR